MDREFWSSAWEEGRLGFHKGEVHPDLREFLPMWLNEPHHRILVPLCGKSVDIPFLAGRGHEVLGVEIVQQAVEEFHAEQRLRAFVDEDGPFRVHSSPGITIYNGDFYDLSAELVGTFDRAWDRAALVAVAPERRPMYVQRLRSMMRPGGRILLNSFTYDQSQRDGPPWSVGPDEIAGLWSDCQLETLKHYDAIDDVHFRELGFHSWMITTTLIQLPG